MEQLNNDLLKYNIMLQSLVQPFLPYSMVRKWPDGTATQSVSYSTMKTTVTDAGGTLHCYLFPGKQNWFVVTDEQTVVRANHRDRNFFLTDTWKSDTSHTLGWGALMPYQKKDGELYYGIEAWRPVSVGLMIKVANTTNSTKNDNNGGFFEAARFNTSELIYDFVFPIEPNNDTDYLYPEHYYDNDNWFVDIRVGDIIPEYEFDEELTDNPTYQVGDLKTMSDGIFALNNFSRTNDFIPNTWHTFKGAQESTNGIQTAYYRDAQYKAKSVHKDNRQIYEIPKLMTVKNALKYLNISEFFDSSHNSVWNSKNKLVSPSFDVIYIKLHVEDPDAIVTFTSIMHQECKINPNALYLSPTASLGWYAPKEYLSNYLEICNEQRKLPLHVTKFKEDRFKNPIDIYYS